MFLNYIIIFADAAGTDSQIKHVSRLLAAQMTAAGIGPGVQEAIERQSQVAVKADSDEEDNIRRPTKSNMPVDDSILRWDMILVEFFISDWLSIS